MKSNTQHLYALETQLLSDGKDHYYRTGEFMHAAEHFAHAVAFVEFADLDVAHSDILHIIANVDWALEELEQRGITYDIDCDAIAAEYEASLPAEDIPF